MSALIEAEAYRLKSLHDGGFSEVEHWPELDDLCELLRAQFSMPVAFASLIDAEEQIVIARRGMDFRKARRSEAFCDHTIRRDGALVVPDATKDERFARTSWVRDGLVRFYAGAPLALEPGLRLGSLCVVDSAPRRFSEADGRLLERAAGLAEALLRSKVSQRSARQKASALADSNVVILKQSEDIWIQHRALQQAGHLAQLGTWQWHQQDDRLLWSDEIYRLTGIPAGTRLDYATGVAIFPPAQRAAFEAALTRSILTGQPFEVELSYETRSGDPRWAKIVGEAVASHGRLEHFSGVFQDVTDQKAQARRLLHVANHDRVTDLPNRTFFLSSLEAALASAGAGETTAALLVVDLDGFKAMNDTRGFEAGNAVLRDAAQRLGALARGGDLVGYLGGDKFAMVLTDLAGRSEGLQRAERLLEALAREADAGGDEPGMRASLGIAFFPDHGREAGRLEQNAEIALAHAKRDGGGIATAFAPAMREAVERRVAEVGSFRRALAAHEIEAHYQPQLRLADDRIKGFEALARWCKADGRIIPAAEFQAAFDDPQAAIRLGERMIDRVSSDLATLIARGAADFRISVNVSGFEFWKGDYPGKVEAAFAARGVPLDRLGIEVTESVFLDRPGSDVAEQLARLRRQGVTISLDDFGTGYASLAHLKRFPIDQVKIDRSFITGITTSAADEAIVAAVVTLARTLGMATVAEGVETPGQMECLRRLGCDHVQGYLTGKAVPFGDLLL